MYILCKGHIHLCLMLLSLHPSFFRPYVPLPKLVIRIWSWVLWLCSPSSWHAVERTCTLLWPSVLLETPFEIACANFHLLSTAVPLTGSRYCVGIRSVALVVRDLNTKIVKYTPHDSVCTVCVRQFAMCAPWTRDKIKRKKMGEKKGGMG